MTAAAAGNRRMAGQRLLDWWHSMPEFVKDDIPEGITAGLLTAVPVALMPNQDPEERAAAIAGGIGAGILGGAASKRIGAAIGQRIHPDELKPGSMAYGLGDMVGRKDHHEVLFSLAQGKAPAAIPVTGEHTGRALGRLLGEEVSALGGTMGALALAQGMDQTPDPVPGPNAGQQLLGAIPGTALNAGLSVAGTGMLDVSGAMRDLEQRREAGAGMPEGFREWLRSHSAFRRRPGPASA